MITVAASRRPIARWWSLAALLLFVCTCAWGAPGVVTVKPEKLTRHFQAYAVVRPIAVVHVRTTESGRVTSVNVLPGQSVHRGEVLARFSGSQIEAHLTALHSQVVGDQARLKAARRLLKLTRDKLQLHLATDTDLLRAVAARSRAEADLESAQAQWRAAHRHTVLRAPADGSVAAVTVAAGERVDSGQTIAVVQPSHRLWLTASYYGRQIRAIRQGMRGRFAPANGGAGVPVRVVSIGPALQGAGGWPVRMRAADTGAGKVGWISGEAGTVTLDGPQVSMVAVPTQALILDRARWWVLVHTPQGDRAQQVTPGRSSGSLTFIRKGLEPGAQVVVTDAYLLYHRHVAAQYQPPD